VLAEVALDLHAGGRLGSPGEESRAAFLANDALLVSLHATFDGHGAEFNVPHPKLEAARRLGFFQWKTTIGSSVHRLVC
jgi:hypothetical protein